jgi:hypothetical protein
MWTDGKSERNNEADFEVEVTNQAVNVRLNASAKSPRARFYWAASFIVLWLGALCLLSFSKGKHGEPSMWHDLMTYPVSSSGFIIPLLICLGVTALLALLSWRYVVMAYPSDENFHCDRSMLTISKVRWLDWQNRDWKTRTYPVDWITGLKYQAVARAKGGAVYGLRFEAGGRKERILPGLGSHDAGKILSAVKAFGIDVND